MGTPITSFRAVRVDPGCLYVGNGTPSTAVDGSDVYIEGTLEVDGALDLDGAVQLDGALTIGTSGAGQDVIFYGDTATACMTWDASDDRMEFTLGRMSFGALSSTAQTGVHLTAAKPGVLDVFADDNNTTLTNEVYATIRSRTMLFKDATGITLVGVKGQLKCADEVDFASGVYACVQGYFETMDDTDIQSGAKFWGVDASIESPASGAVTVDSGGIMAGLHAELTGGGQFVQSSGGILAGLYIDEQVTTGTWGYGVYVAAGTYGLYVSHTGTRGLYISTTTAAPNLGDGYGGAIEANFEVSGAQAGHIAAASAWVNHNGTVAAGGNMVCARNDGIYVNTGGSGDLTNAIAIFGARMHMLSAGNETAACPFSLNVSGTTTDALFYLYNEDGSTSMGYTVDATTDDSKIGAVPLYIDGATSTKYWVRIYDGAS